MTASSHYADVIGRVSSLRKSHTLSYTTPAKITTSLLYVPDFMFPIFSFSKETKTANTRIQHLTTSCHSEWMGARGRCQLQT